MLHQHMKSSISTDFSPSPTAPKGSVMQGPSLWSSPGKLSVPINVAKELLSSVARVVGPQLPKSSGHIPHWFSQTCHRVNCYKSEPLNQSTFILFAAPNVTQACYQCRQGAIPSSEGSRHPNHLVTSIIKYRYLKGIGPTRAKLVRNI